jgi:hypothetical protein
MEADGLGRVEREPSRGFLWAPAEAVPCCDQCFRLEGWRATHKRE